MYPYNLEIHSFLPCQQHGRAGVVIPPVGGGCDDVHDVTFQVVCGVGAERFLGNCNIVPDLIHPNVAER